MMKANTSPEHLARLAEIAKDPLIQLRRRNAMRMNWAMRSPPIEKTCPSCGKVFVVRREYATQKYCSIRCRKPPTWLMDPEIQRRRLAAMDAVRPPPDPSLKVTKACPTCGKPFVSWLVAEQTYCSKACVPREIHVLAGRAAAATNLASGKPLGSQWRFYVHDGHYHRSKSEMEWCERLCGLYDRGMVHTNVHLKGLEIDFVIGSDRHDPSTWLKVVEYHAVRTWEGETKEGYETKRRRRLAEIGVSCPVEILFTRA